MHNLPGVVIKNHKGVAVYLASFFRETGGTTCGTINRQYSYYPPNRGAGLPAKGTLALKSEPDSGHRWISSSDICSRAVVI